MSGFKHAMITISQAEYRRLHELDMQRRFGLKKSSEGDDPGSTALLNAYRQVEERQADYENVIASLNQEMAEVEADMSQSILRIQADYYQNLIESTQSMQEQQLETQTIFQTLLNDRTAYFEDIIQTEQSKTQNRLNALFQQVTSIARDQEEKEDYTRQWIENCHHLSEFIEDHYEHSKYAPKEFDKISQRLDIAEHDLRRGLIDSGLQFAQEAFLQFSELRVSLEEKTSEWQALYHVAKTEVENISQQVSSTPHIPAIGIDGEELNIEIDLEFWSDGRYSVIQKALKKLATMFETHTQEISFEDLNRLSTEIIPKYKQEFLDTIFVARQNALNSQLKINVAYLAMKALEKHGFTLEQAQFDHDDQRDAFSAQLCGMDGSHIILQVAPNTENLKTNHLIVQTLDDSIHTEDEFMQRWQEINSSLQQAGVEVGPVQVGADPSDTKDRATMPTKRSPLNPSNSYYYVQSHRTPPPSNQR